VRIFSRRTLSIDLPAARILAAYRVPERALYDDALIAAVAQATGKIVVTRNTRHFQPLGVRCLDPWGDR
jgi:predicted nucleic acid-binding protein